MRGPIISPNTAVVGATKQSEFLIERGFVLTSVDSKWHTFTRHEIVHVRNIATVAQHLQERISKVLVELIPIDCLSSRRSIKVENENSLHANISRLNKGPTDCLAGLRFVVDQNSNITVVVHIDEIESIWDSYGFIFEIQPIIACCKPWKRRSRGSKVCVESRTESDAGMPLNNAPSMIETRNKPVPRPDITCRYQVLV